MRTFQKPARPSRSYTRSAVSSAGRPGARSSWSILTRSKGATAVRETTADIAPATSSLPCSR